MKSLIYSTLVALSTLSVSSAWTAERPLRDLARRLYVSCTGIEKTVRCQNSMRIWDHGMRDFPQATLDRFQSISNKLGETWSDGILEGDYHGVGNLNLDQIQGIFEQEQLVAYRITYSMPADDIAQCSYYQTQSLQGCTEGAIMESAFVSTDLVQVLLDHNAVAKFVAKSR